MKKQALAAIQKWEIKCDFEGESFVFMFHSNGKGKCKDLYDEEVDFSWDTDAISGLDSQEEIRCALDDLTDELFWSDINSQLDDPVLTDQDFADHREREPEFVCGSREELERLTKLILYSFPDVWDDDADKRSIVFRAATDDGGADVCDDSYDWDLGNELSDEDKARILELLSYAVNQNQPTGDYYEYNDGANNRRSGYGLYPLCVKTSISRPSYHELAGARSSLRKELAVNMAAEDIGRLLPVVA